MEAIAHNKAFAKKVHIPQSVGQEFVDADKGKTFKRGGQMALKKHEMNQAKELRRIADEEEHEAHEMKRGGKVKKMAMGGGVDPRVAMAMMAAKRGRRPMAPAMGPMDNAPMAPAVPGMKHGGLSKAHHKHLAEHHLSMAEHHMAQHEAHGGRVKKMARGGQAFDGPTVTTARGGKSEVEADIHEMKKGSKAIMRGEHHRAHGEHALQERGHTRGRNLGDSGKIEGIESEKNMKAFEKEGMKRGGKVHKYAAGGHVGKAHSRADGIARKGHTKTKFC